MLPVPARTNALGFKRRWFTGRELLDTLNMVASEAERTLDESQLSHYWDGTSFREFISGIYKKYGLYEDDRDHVHQYFRAYDTQHRCTKDGVKRLVKNMKMLNQQLFDSIPDEEDMLSSFLHIYYDLSL